MVKSLALMFSTAVIFQNIAFLTSTIITRFQVGAALSAKAWWITFVKVLADPSVSGVEHFSSGALAKRSNWSLDAAIGASVPITINVVTAGTFIGAIGTVQFVITDLLDVHAMSRFKTGTLPFSGSTRGIGCSAPVFGGFVGTIATIVLPITDIAFENTFFVVAFEVIIGAIHQSTRTGFVRVILAIRGSVTIPSLRNTDTGLFTFELFVRTLIWRHTRTT